MIYDTAGNQIIEPIRTCNCGLAGGCLICRPQNGKSGLTKILKKERMEINANNYKDILKLTKKSLLKIWKTKNL